MNHGSTPAYADAHLQPAAAVPPASPPGGSPRPVLGHYVSGVTPTEPCSYVSGVVPGAPASYVTGARADRAPGYYTDRDAWRNVDAGLGAALREAYAAGVNADAPQQPEADEDADAA